MFQPQKTVVTMQILKKTYYVSTKKMDGYSRRHMGIQARISRLITEKMFVLKKIMFLHFYVKEILHARWRIRKMEGKAGRNAWLPGLNI